MHLDSWPEDLRSAWRGVRRAKAVSAAVVLTLAAGMTGTTVMFALLQGVLLRPLPVRDEARLLVAWLRLPGSGFAHHPFTIDQVDIIGRESRTLEDVAALSFTGATQSPVTGGESAGHLGEALVSGRFFDVLGVRPARGRLLAPLDDRDGAEPVLVISHALWKSRYGGAEDVIGRTIDLDERRFRIVGVAPPDFGYPRGVEAWRTLHSVPAAGPFGEYARRDVDLIGRVRAGATVAQADAELRAVMPRLEAQKSSNAPRGLVPVVRPYREAVVGDVRTALTALFGVVALVLFIAAANAANLLLLRGEARATEFAVRAALGAGRQRLARQVLLESAVLALAAAVVGIAAAFTVLPPLVAVVPDGLPRAESVRVDAGVALFSLGAAFVAAAGAGLAPALWCTRADLSAHLRSGSRGSAGLGSGRRRRGLVAFQAALAVSVVAGALLLTRSLLNLQSLDLGMTANRLLVVQLQVPRATHGDRERHLHFLNTAVAQLEALPSIEAATPVNAPPFSGTSGWDVPRFTAEGQSADDAAANPALNLESIHPNYFSALGVRIVRGRAFTAADRGGTPAVAIVSEDVAARVWPDANPLGKRIKMGGVASTDPWRTVVGVAQPTRYRELPQPRPTVYLAAEQFLVTAQMLVIRTAAPVEAVAPLIRHRITAVDAAVNIVRIVPFARLLDAPLARPRFNTIVILVFGTAALLLASVGLYAVASADVRQRSVEFGVRVAFGATAASVRAQVLRDGLLVAGTGALLGLAAAAAAAGALRSLLFGVPPLDPYSMAAAAALVLGASIAACVFPARRATRVDPIVLLRSD